MEIHENSEKEKNNKKAFHVKKKKNPNQEHLQILQIKREEKFSVHTW